MQAKGPDNNSPTDLRRRAEALLRDQSPQEGGLPAEEHRLVEELRVHQIELELQNQALQQAQLERDLLLEQYTDLYDSAPVGYFDLDENGIIRRANRTGAGLLGQDRESLIGQRFSRYVAPADQEDYHFCLVRLFQHEDREGCQVRLNPPGVPAFYAHLEGQVSREGLLEDRRCRLVVSDVSQQAQVQQVLQRAHDEMERRVEERTAELARSNQELEQFARVASHDLQAPLRAVTLFLQQLETHCGDQLDAQASEYVGYAVDGASRMQAMIKALLRYARIGVREEEIVPTDCETVLEHVLFDLQPIIEEKEASITHGPLPTVRVDGMQLGQVLQNLIGNALKFHGDELPRIHLSARREGDEWRFAVRDDGIGIDPAQSERAFEIFQCLHTQEEYPGTGVGLALCKKIVERHGGRIWVESQPGQGSTFSFTLPAARSGS